MPGLAGQHPLVVPPPEVLGGVVLDLLDAVGDAAGGERVPVETPGKNNFGGVEIMLKGFTFSTLATKEWPNSYYTLITLKWPSIGGQSVHRHDTYFPYSQFSVAHSDTS